MRKTRLFIMTFIMAAVLFFIPNISKATVNVTKNIYANNGSAKFTFSGLNLDQLKEYEFGLTKTAATEVEKWHQITDYTTTTAVIDIQGSSSEFANIITSVETGYITIREKDTTNIVLNHQEIDLSIPYLRITNYNVIKNGMEFGFDSSNGIQINFWNAGNSTPYYKYEKITDEKVIAKYKEIKSKNGSYNDLETLLKQEAPTDSNWTKWYYWNEYGDITDPGYGYPTRTINAPDYGLYYLWIYVASLKDMRNLYGYILVDNLQPEIELTSISLPKTKEVELGKTITLKPTFNPENTTNKIVTWSSSDTSVATVNNAGKVTPKKVGSTIITVTSQDGMKKAFCTVTVVKSSKSSSSTSSSSSKNTSSSSSKNTSSSSSKKDTTTAKGKIPYTGANYSIIFVIAIVIIAGIIAKVKYDKLKGI